MSNHVARAKRAAARRAVYAMLQDDAIEFPVLDDLDARVERAVAIAMSTKTAAAAIDLAAHMRTIYHVINNKKRRRA